jgi:type I restriction enzyme, S subunit
MAPIGSVLQVLKEPVDRANLDFADLQPITIHFDGSIDPREVELGREYKMDLLFARPGNVVVAKIDLKNGAVGIVPDWPNVVVTNHFAVYEPDCSRLVPEYLTRIIQTDFFKAYLWRNKVGAEGRKEVKLDFFESISIPLPPLDTQRAIVARWQAAQEEIAAANEQAQQLRDSITQDALRNAGVDLKLLVKRPSMFALPWSRAERWGVEFNRWDWSPKDLLLSSRHPMVRLAEVAWINPTGDVSPLDHEAVSFVPMAAVSDESGEILSPEIRPYQEVKSGYTRFADQDVIWAKITPCMQNGKCAVAKDLQNGVGCGSTEFHVIRSRNAAEVLPKYLWVILRLGHVRKAAQRYFIGSAGQQRVPADFLTELHIPLPPLDMQREIVRQVETGRAEISHLREQASQRAKIAKAEIEAAILGRVP